MIVGVMTDFEMTFTGELFKVAWQNTDFVSKIRYLKKIGFFFISGPNQCSEIPTFNNTGRFPVFAVVLLGCTRQYDGIRSCHKIELDKISALLVCGFLVLIGFILPH